MNMKMIVSKIPAVLHGVIWNYKFILKCHPQGQMVGRLGQSITLRGQGQKNQPQLWPQNFQHCRQVLVVKCEG